jgi:hypothetical protein
MRELSVNWSDLADAAALSRALIQREPHLPEASTAAASYARFAVQPAAQPAAQPAVSRASAAAAAATPSPQPLTLDSWEVFLAWSLELTRARASFVVDSQGFVIASRGNLPADGFEGIGAELCYAMDQLYKIDPQAGPLRLIELQFESSRLIGVRTDAGDLGTILVGFQGSRSVTDEVRDAIVRQLVHSLPGLR